MGKAKARLSLAQARAKRRSLHRRGKAPIVIRPQNRGKLRKAAGAKKGRKIPVAKLRKMARSRDPKVRKRAQFALNARQWNRRA